jgi:uncharacterized repeat protein (TIGR04076 family)
MSHFKQETPADFWKGFQQHMGYSDAEMLDFKNDPKKIKNAPKMADPRIRNSTLVFEVVKSHGCAEGMKVGDKLYFNGVALLDAKRSSNWCAYALAYAVTKAEVCHNLLLQGIDPNQMYGDYFSCYDCGSELGWGQIVIKAYVINEDKK